MNGSGIDSSLLEAIKFIFTESWKFFANTTVPGTSFSFATLAISVLLIDFGLKFIGWVLGSNLSKDNVKESETFLFKPNSRKDV